MKPDWPLRRRLSAVADGLPWQALQYALARWDGGDGAYDGPPPELREAHFARRIKVAICPGRLRVGGAERTLLELALALDPEKVAPVVVAEGEIPFGDLELSGIDRAVEVGDADLAVWTGPYRPVEPGRAVGFVSSPSAAMREDLLGWPRESRAVAASHSCARMAESILGGWGDVPVVWNGAARRPMAPRPSGWFPGRFVVGCLGRASWEKNFTAALAALLLLPSEVVLYVGGEGPDGPIYQRAADAWRVGDRLARGGVVGAADFLSRVDLLLAPSIFEATPSVVAEAMIHGVPVVATKVGDLPAILGGGRGILLDDPSPESIADGGGAAVADRPSMARMSVAGCEFAREHLSAERMARGWEAALAAAMGWA